jgi:hypothetical protein
VAILVIALVVVARATSKRIDGISCDPGTQGPYHARARLTMIVVAHKQYVYPPSGVGVSTLHLCQYWIHTPDSSGTIAVDAPHRVVPTLGQFFDVWGQPLAWPRVWRYSAGTGALLAYVAGRLHPGDPRMIKLYDGTTVTLVIGSDWSSMPQQPTAFTQ